MKLSDEVSDCYVGLAPLYHLINPDWEASMQRQATALDSIIRETGGADARMILDLSCGIRNSGRRPCDTRIGFRPVGRRD